METPPRPRREAERIDEMMGQRSKIALPVSDVRALAWWACYGVRMAYGGSYEKTITGILYDLQTKGILPKNERPEFGALRAILDSPRTKANSAKRDV